MAKVVINRCFGGFGLSHEGVLAYCKYKKIKVWPISHPNPSHERLLGPIYSLVLPSERQESHEHDFQLLTLKERKAYNELWTKQTLYDRDIPRDDEALVKTVEELGTKANGNHAKLAVVEIPDDVKWEISEYDGNETIEEVHRSWS